MTTELTEIEDLLGLGTDLPVGSEDVIRSELGLSEPTPAAASRVESRASLERTLAAPVPSGTLSEAAAGRLVAAVERNTAVLESILRELRRRNQAGESMPPPSHVPAPAEDMPVTEQVAPESAEVSAVAAQVRARREARLRERAEEARQVRSAARAPTAEEEGDEDRPAGAPVGVTANTVLDFSVGGGE